MPMAIIPQMGYQNTGRMYGMIPPNAVPRNTVMSGMTMFGSGGSMNGSPSLRLYHLWEENLGELVRQLWSNSQRRILFLTETFWINQFLFEFWTFFHTLFFGM
ncbi:hypothetical protein BYT27DRAFT_6340171 [Phlegmacium glaucopus]|nr:hypothetical protein BYT27DRAFT_6340171 [Phlegmacium glaucopus]